MSTQSPRFAAPSRVLHWLMAVLILAMLFIGVGMAASASGRYSTLVSIHKPLGIAILILVGFESVTAMGEEAKNAKRDIPRAVILSLLIQGGFCYLFEYFAANYFLHNGYGATANASGQIVIQFTRVKDNALVSGIEIQ